jgi:hypothetical protein
VFQKLRLFRELRTRLGGSVRLAAALSTMTFVSSCGGDHGPSTYALNAYVSGLTGSGLQVTLNGGAPISIPGNSQTTIARLKDGAGYTVVIGGQPVNPAELCTAANPSGKISGNNVDVMITCTTDGAVQTSTIVSLDPGVPTAIGAQITTIASPSMSGSLNSPLSVPAASTASESIVLALDAAGDIVLASLVTQYQTTLSADSTAVTLTRIAIGPIDSTASVAVLNASIRATPEYPHLVALIQTALEAQLAPTASDAVVSSTSLVITQLVASATSAPASVHTALRRGTKALNPTILQKAPDTLLSWSGANTAFQSVQLQGVTATAATVSNGTSIAWSAFASDPQSGQPICGADGCETVLMPPKLAQQADFILGTPITYPTKDVPATNTAYNLTLQQSKLSIAANVTQSVDDFASYELTLAYGGKEAPALIGCVNEIVTTAVSPEAVVAGLGNQSGTAIESYINSTLQDSVFNTGGIKAIGTCLGLSPANVNDGFLYGMFKFVFKFGASVLAKPVIASAGLGFELGQTLYYLGPNFSPVTVGICVGTPPGKAFGIVDCAKNFAFNPTSLYMAPTATGSAPAITAIGTVTATTLVPTDLTLTIVPALVSIDQTTNNITATDSPSSAPAVVTATSPSTSATGSYQVFVVDPILTPSALAVDTTSSAQTVTVTLLGPNENPIVLPKNFTWNAQLIKDSDSSSVQIVPTTTGPDSATWTIPSQTTSGRLDVTAYDPFGKSYGFESITVTNTGVGVGVQTFYYTGTALSPCNTAQPAPGPLLATVVLAAPISAGFSGTLSSSVITAGNYVASLSLTSSGVGSQTESFTGTGGVGGAVLTFANGQIQSWSFGNGGIYNGSDQSYITISAGPPPLGTLVDYVLTPLFCGQSLVSGTWSP